MRLGLVICALLAFSLLAGGCGEEGPTLVDDTEPEMTTTEPDAVDTSLAAAEFESTFGEPPDACEAGYGEWVGDDVTYCYSGELFGNPPRPFNTGCYITDTGDDVTVAYRNINGTGTC